MIAALILGVLALILIVVYFTQRESRDFANMVVSGTRRFLKSGMFWESLDLHFDSFVRSHADVVFEHTRNYAQNQGEKLFG